MLVLTENATQAVEAIVTGQQLPDGGGLRVTAVAAPSDNGATPEPQLHLSVVEAPEPEDEVVDGAPVYIDPRTAQLVADKVLDARISEEHVQFTLRQQDAPAE